MAACAPAACHAVRADAARACSQTLSTHRLLSAPVLRATSDACAADEGAFEGFCDVAAILHHVLSALEDYGATSTDDTVRVMDALTALAPDALQAPVSAVSRNDGDLIYRGYESCSLLDIVTAGFVHPFHLRDVSICHRVRCGHALHEVPPALLTLRCMCHAPRPSWRLRTCGPSWTPRPACQTSARGA